MNAWQASARLAGMMLIGGSRGLEIIGRLYRTGLVFPSE
jgi:hypothetical protein